MPGKCLEFAQKVGITWIFNSKPGKSFFLISKFMCFKNYVLRYHLQKKSFTFDISTLLAQALHDSIQNLIAFT